MQSAVFIYLSGLPRKNGTNERICEHGKYPVCRKFFCKQAELQAEYYFILFCYHYQLITCSYFSKILQIIYLNSAGDVKAQGEGQGNFGKIHISTWYNTNSMDKSSFPGITSNNCLIYIFIVQAIKSVTLMFCTEIINVSKQTIGVFPFRYSIPIQYGGPYSDVTTKFPGRSNL